MERRQGTLAIWSHLIHKHFFGLVIASYILASVAPAPGLRIRELTVGGASVPMLLLSALLLNAGLGIRPSAIAAMLARPKLLGAGLAANHLMPLAFIFAVSILLAGWHNGDEAQSILVGLALVVSMPIAGSSTAWTQNSDGDLTLSLALVLLSTLLSPLTTPLGLRAVGLVATGEYAEALHGLAAGGTSLFLGLCVFTPALAGIALRRAAGDRRHEAMQPVLKLVNLAVLLVLNYSNASVSLPRAVADPDADFLAALLAIVASLCALAFAAGWLIARVFKATLAEGTALMYGLGMSNNGTGLVLASMALADYPRVMLPIIVYNLVQHLVAGLVDRWISRTPAAPSLSLDDGRRDVPAYAR